jgi:hypothetical protein
MVIKETELKRRIRAWLKAEGAWYYMPVPGGYGKHGVPDFLCMIEGVSFSIETKTTGRKPTMLQELEMKEMDAAGWMVFVVDSEETMARMMSEVMSEVTRDE